MKIAILDTGIAPNNVVHGYRDFIKDSETPCTDSTGHGTKVFRLLRRICDNAHIFVGRIWDKSQLEDNTKSAELLESVSSIFHTQASLNLNIAQIPNRFAEIQAIRWAKQKWKVDIIIIPSGLQTRYDSVETAIEEANISRILTFASTSNYANLEDLYFPGCLYAHGKVITLFSTNAMVKASTPHNPTPRETAKDKAFAILGEDIVLDSTTTLNGTSFSTTIGAGVAARVIDFARVPTHRGKIGKVEEFKKVEGMLSVFGRMAPRTDNSYRCMAPWQICDIRQMDSEERADAIKRQQDEVCQSLREALRNI